MFRGAFCVCISVFSVSFFLFIYFIVITKYETLTFNIITVCTLLAIEFFCDKIPQVFGAYLSVSWEERNDDTRKSPYFGNGECFLFTLTPKEVHYPWVGTTKDPKEVERSESMFMRATANEMAVGGG